MANSGEKRVRGRFCGLRLDLRDFLLRGTMAQVQHLTVYFTGRVQGVGFRYATMQVAREFEVSGYVKNLVDGRVIVEIEGAARELADFVEALEERMHGYIRKTEREEAKREAEFSGFEIR